MGEQRTEDSPASLATRCVHGGWRASPAHPGVTLPIDRSTTFELDDAAYALRAAGELERARVYARESGPTIEVVERHLATLEGAEDSVLFASGMAALHAAVLGLTPKGGRVVLASALYGGSPALVDPLAERIGSPVSTFDPRDPDQLESVLAGEPALVLVESLSNPSLWVADLPELAARTHRCGGLLLVDATFASPVVQRPLEHGADLVWHSATKSLGGHSDLLAGVLAGPSEHIAACRSWRTRAGASPDPQAAWLLWRGLRTLHLRVREASASAAFLADRLAEHAAVTAVRHPSRFEGVERAVADRMLASPGSMLTFDVRGGDAVAREVCRKLELVTEAASLGGVESLVSPPARMSHNGWTRDELAAVGIGEGCLRLSVGVEDPGDLWRDLERALAGR